MLITRLLLVLEVWDGKPTYRKSWAGNLLVWSDLTLGPSFKVKPGWLKLTVLITRLFVFLEVAVLHQPIGNHGLRIFWYGQISPWAPPSRLSDVGMALLSFLSGGYNLHWFSDAIGLVCYKISHVASVSLANLAIFLCNQDIRPPTMGCKRGFTSHRMCMHVLVMEKNWQICKGHWSYMCDFITECWGC